MEVRQKTGRNRKIMIALVEDDKNIRELVVYTLGTMNMAAKGYAAPSEFYQSLAQERPSLVLLDLMLPEEDGLSVLRRLRAAPETARVPVIILTARGSEYDRVVGLNCGADDYVTKPFGMMELVARIKAVLRRTAAPAAEEYCAGALRVCPQQHLVTVDGARVTLTRKEYELLLLLMRSGGAVFSRDQLLNEIWGYSFTGENRTVDVHIRTLRQKLGSAGECIETVRGVGYRIRPQ